jgi:hypothetical protein
VLSAHFPPCAIVILKRENPATTDFEQRAHHPCDAPIVEFVRVVYLALPAELESNGPAANLYVTPLERRDTVTAV